MRVILLLLVLSSTVICFTDKVFADLVHYASFAKLTSCISKGVLQPGVLFPLGGCHLLWCLSERNSDARIMMIRVAPTDETSTALAVVDDKNKEIIIAFRASSTTADWISDLLITAVDYEPVSKAWRKSIPKCVGCKVHSGFYKNLDSINEELISYVTQLYKDHKEYKLTIVGHSLGLALLTLCAIEFKLRGFSPKVYTFAAPRMFNREMSSWVNELFASELLLEQLKNDGDFQTGLIRVVHTEDYVPMLPPKLHQAGVEFFIRKKDLPHPKESVVLTGLLYLNEQDGDLYRDSRNATQSNLEWLHGYEHRTYFMTINNCGDTDPELLGS